MERKINGWLICKLKNQYNSYEESIKYSEMAPGSMLSHISELAYGIISEDVFPPSSNWVFLANGESFVRYLTFYVATHLCLSSRFVPSFSREIFSRGNR